MMKYRAVKHKIVDLLSSLAAGRYQVIGNRKQSKHSDGVKDNSRMVQVYYTQGNFPKNAGGMYTDKAHDTTYDIVLTASAAARGDIAILDDPNSTAEQKAQAIKYIREASETADELIDELTDIIYQIMMDARYDNLLFSKQIISNRWIETIQKDNNLEKGDLVVKTVLLKYTCRVMETVTGDTPFAPAQVEIDSTVVLDDSNDESGVTVTNDNS